ncbi:MAG: DUF1674 domain-containing protein [Pseudomonadota bacterium]|nr:DUF1674 domain-containing protein [Pseudomonadota bacterium]
MQDQTIIVGEPMPGADLARAAEIALTTQAPVAGELPAEEVGGREGPDPTRFGDWERNGRCIDF